MLTNYCVIPTARDDDLTRNIVRELFDQSCTTVLAYNDGHLYDAMNHVWRSCLADEPGEFNIAFVNNDVSFNGPVISEMAELLRNIKDAGVVFPILDTDPIPTLPHERSHGLRGYCFMVKGELAFAGLPMFYTGYSWYWGDTEFFRWVRNLGYGVWQVNTSSISHIGGASTPHGGEWARRKKADEALFANRMGER